MKHLTVGGGVIGSVAGPHPGIRQNELEGPIFRGNAGALATPLPELHDEGGAGDRGAHPEHLRHAQSQRPRRAPLPLRDALAIFDVLETNDSAVQILGDDTLRKIAREFGETLGTMPASTGLSMRKSGVSFRCSSAGSFATTDAHSISRHRPQRRSCHRLKDSQSSGLEAVRRTWWPLSNMAFAMVLRRLDAGDAVPNGFRSTLKDWSMEQTSFP